MNNPEVVTYSRLMIPVAIMLLSLIVGFILERIGLKLLTKLVEKTNWRGEHIIVNVFRHMLVIWSVIIGLSICLHQPLIDFYLVNFNVNDYYQYLKLAQKALTALIIASFTIVIARLATGLIEFYRSQGIFPVNRLFDKATRIVIYSLGTVSIINLVGFSTYEINKYIVPFAIVIVSFVIGFIADNKGLKLLYQLAKETTWDGDELIVNCFKGIVVFWAVLAGVTAAIDIFPLPGALIVVITRGIIICFLGSATLLIYRLAISFIQLYGNKNQGSPVITSLFENITKLVVFSLGFLIILQSIGIGITPLITALGIGGVSIGLALKGPLENLASGITIISSKKVRPGDYIKLTSGEEGYVTDVELRYTIIKKITGNLQIIPNAHLISSSFTNYGLPEKRLLVPVEVGVGYNSDLEKVEAVTLEVAQYVIQGFVRTPTIEAYKPFLCFNRFGYYSINFTVFLQVEDYFDQFLVRHKFIKELYKRYQQEGITIPFPIQATSIDGQSSSQPEIWE